MQLKFTADKKMEVTFSERVKTVTDLRNDETYVMKDGVLMEAHNRLTLSSFGELSKRLASEAKSLELFAEHKA